MLIECIATTLEDAKRLEQSGADRIELVSSLTEGGLTPSFGLIEKVIKDIKIPVNVMVRPHAQSFCYTDDEINIMKRDIEMIRVIGANGVVLGVLDEHQQIDLLALEDLLEGTIGLDVTFHRAIDSLADPVEGVRKLTKYKEVTTILTSGGFGDWTERLQTIKEMNRVSKHISILVGSGLTKNNISDVHERIQLNQYHFGTSLREKQSPVHPIDVQAAREIMEILQGRGDGNK
ncbi:copper homeostasis protein CutC [Shimazuella kribbensis]|uniref:copper homeostasis protein CutC n=1 Tax=Shimazuella kribbensis TaxID=139808 RepID=UPI000418F4E5|nr:copper homeostasis protein CutC [Shimazuella kribbensis]